MRHIKTLLHFLYESKIPLSHGLDSYEVIDNGKGKFSVSIDGVKKDFSVIPIPKNLEEYTDLFFELTSAMNSDSHVLYMTIKSLEDMPYTYGNLIPTSTSLKNVPGLSIKLTEEQKKLLESSEEEFLKTYYASLGKSTKAEIDTYLKRIAQLYAIVLEALAYYVRSESEA